MPDKIESYLDGSLPVPVGLLFRNVVNKDGKTVTLVLGVIPEAIGADDADHIMLGNVVLMAQKNWKDKKRNGWLIEDVLTDPDWLAPPKVTNSTGTEES